MCLITACPIGTEKNIEDLAGFIKQGMQTNTHGSGFAYKKGGSKTVYLSKGYMTSVNLINAIKEAELGVDDELMIHHRIGTSGSREAFNMHPFILTTNEELAKKTEGTFKNSVMAHNGVITEFADYSADQIFNDTFLFVKHFMGVPEILQSLKNDESLFKRHYSSIINGEKLAFIFDDAPMVLLGNFVEDDGYYHSNTGYKSYHHDRGGVSYGSEDVDSYLNRTSSWWDKNRAAKLEEEAREKKKLKKLHSTWKEDPSDENFATADGDDDNDTVSDDDRINGFCEMPYASGFGFGRGMCNVPLIGGSKIENTLKTMENKKALNGLKFLGTDIYVTSKNYRHFSFVPTVDVFTNTIGVKNTVPKGLLYTLENYDENTSVNYLVEKHGEQVMRLVDMEKNMHLFTVYVNHEYRDKYNDLNKFILANFNSTRHSVGLSPSMCKKIANILKRAGNVEYIKFKHHGTFFKDDLSHLLDISKVDKDVKVSTILTTDEQYKKNADELVRGSIIWDKNGKIVKIVPSDVIN